MWYVGVFVVPEEVGEGEEGEVVVGSFEAGEAGENDDGEEEFFDVLDHLIQFITIMWDIISYHTFSKLLKQNRMSKTRGLFL